MTSSLARRRRRMAKRSAQPAPDRIITGLELRLRIIEHALFGETTPPTEEHRQERGKMCAQFKSLLDVLNGAPNHVWAHLRQERRGYDPKHDGPSEWMSFVDDVQALQEDEAETERKDKEAVR